MMEEGHHNDAESMQAGERGRGILPEAGSWLCCLPCNWLKSNTSLHKASITAAMLLVTSLLVASPVLFLISGSPGAEKVDLCHPGEGCRQEDETCGTSACYEAALTIGNAISTAEDPCQDFYKYSCGSWAQQRPGLRQLQSQVDAEIQQLLETTAQSGPFEKVGRFYNSCIKNKHESSVNKTLSLLEELGGYMGVGESNLTTLISRLILMNGSPLFDLYLDKDLHNASQLAIYLDLPKPIGRTIKFFHSLPSQFNFEVILYKMRKARVRRHINESEAYIYLKDSFEEKQLLLMEELLLSFIPRSLNPEHKAKEIHNILLLTTMLSKIYPKTKDILFKRQNNGMYKAYTVMTLQDYYGFVQWKRLLANVFCKNVSLNDVIYVVAPNYMDKLSKVIAHFQTRIIHNTLLLVYATDLLNELFSLPQVDHEKSMFCTRLMVNVLSQEVSALYISQYTKIYLQHLIMRAKKLLDSLKETLTTRVDTLPWLDDVSRKAALSKIASLEGHVPLWSQMWNMTFISSLLRDVEVKSNDFIENLIRRYKQLRDPLCGQRKGDVFNKKWPYPPVSINAFYEVSTNNVVIPLAVLTQPYFRIDTPGYMQYGALGTILSHELLHSLDMSESWYSDNGSKISWLSKKTTLKLEARLECISKQYADTFHKQVLFRGSKVPVQFDWNITRNENMADISGLQIAFETWRMHHEDEKKLPGLNLNPKQLFFINAAQVYCTRITAEDYIRQVEKDFHTPAPERVNGIMMNSQAFSEVFSCPLGSKMNPLRKCSAY